MVKSKLYQCVDGEAYTMEEMIERVYYWWVRYEGSRTEDGKEFCNMDLTELIHRLKLLHDEPEKFNFNKPDMEDEDDKS